MYKTIEEFTRAGGVASAKKRLSGKSKAEISEIMKKIRAKGKQKEGENQSETHTKSL